MSDSEIIDIVDEQGIVINTVSRGEAERDNNTTENVLIFVFNSVGKVWVQLRSRHKKHYPGMWDISACGGVISGETPEASARRETFEETGLEVELHFVERFLNVFPGDHGEKRSRLSHLYVGLSDQIPKINDEVEEFKIWDVSELKDDIIKNEASYTPSFLLELDKAEKGYKNL